MSKHSKKSYVLSPIPESIQAGPFTFVVRTEEHAINRQSVKDERSLEGAVNFANQEILIKPGQQHQAEQDTVLHECLHVILRQWETGFDEAEEEKLVMGLSIHLLDLLHRNPKLVEYLMARNE